MKRLFYLLIALLILVSCKGDDDGLQDNNPNLTNPVINLNLNLNLPEYSPLNFPGSSVVVTQQGIRGVVVYCVNTNMYTAFELSDPNHPPSSCSRMNVSGVVATCPCEGDDNSYDLLTGQHQTDPSSNYPMQPYRVQRAGDNVVITN
ncbi:hypothetical protein [Altibacter sp. HG106]|uniref:hypothetical protein n=1 Tax=Altibacter sp. HG106 TaxID=3023937 RepID=UPI00235091F4|nr:hypothetical protein [Altibacter sp. HG106]MDC7995229.1 hypothetical protein [Altibacter sp. HG106]